MLRRLTPFLATLLSMLLDTAVIPVFYHGAYTVPLTLIIAMCIGLLNGRLQGLLWGMIGGLLVDITAGTLGYMTFFFMLAGFLIGLLVDESTDRPVTGVKFHLRRAAVSFALSLIGEIFIAFYHYFITAVWAWSSVQYILIRSAIVALGVVLLCPLFDRVQNGRKSRSNPRSNAGSKREVKHF